MWTGELKIDGRLINFPSESNRHVEQLRYNTPTPHVGSARQNGLGPKQVEPTRDGRGPRKDRATSGGGRESSLLPMGGPPALKQELFLAIRGQIIVFTGNFEEKNSAHSEPQVTGTPGKKRSCCTAASIRSQEPKTSQKDPHRESLGVQHTQNHGYASPVDMQASSWLPAGWAQSSVS